MSLPEEGPGPVDPPIEVLGLPEFICRKLKAAGYLSVSRVEQAFGTDAQGASEPNVHGVGRKSISIVRDALRTFRSRTGSPPSPPPAAETVPPNPQTKPGGDARERQPRRTPNWVDHLPRIAAIGITTVGLVIGVPLLFSLGEALTQSQFFIAIVLLSLFASVLLFLAAKSTAVLEGTIPGTSVTFRFTGAAAAFLGSVSLLWWQAPHPANQTVDVYLVTEASPDSPPTPFKGEFTLVYRRAHGGQGTEKGIDGHVTIRDLAVGATELEVNRLDCYGYAVAETRDNPIPPWRYPIRNGTVDIRLIRTVRPEDPLPKWKDVLSLLREKGKSEQSVLERGRFPKREVSLSIVNDVPFPVTFAAYDCAAAVRQDVPKAVGTAWTRCKDDKNIQPGQISTWGTFEEFEDPSGWFALYVRFEDARRNRVVQQPLGVFQLFDLRAPRVVIEQSGAPGIELRIDPKRSLLGGGSQ